MAMEHGVVPPLGRAHPDDPHRTGLHGAIEGEEEEHGHHEKKPVLKKVKEKVKKIKDTIKMKHGHGHGHGHDSHDDDMHDQDTSEEEDGYEEDENEEEEGGGERANDPEVHGGISAKHDAGTTGPAAASAAGHIMDWEKVPLREVMGGLEEDPGAPKSATSGQLRASDEVGESPVIQSFEAMAISEQPRAISAEKSQESREQNAAAKEEEGRTQSYTGKLSSATKATAATVYEKVAQAGVTVKEKVQGAATAGAGEGAQSYTEKISSTAKDAASTVYSKVAEAGTAVMEKVHPGPATSEDVGASTMKQPGVGVTGYLTEKLKPGEEDRALSEMISDTLRMRKEKVHKEAPAATESSDSGGGRGVGVMGTIRGAVTSMFGGGRRSRSSPANETERKVAEEAKGGDQPAAEDRTQVQEMELDRGTGAAD